jgi:hypothetical protein
MEAALGVAYTKQWLSLLDSSHHVGRGCAALNTTPNKQRGHEVAAGAMDHFS